MQGLEDLRILENFGHPNQTYGVVIHRGQVDWPIDLIGWQGRKLAKPMRINMYTFRKYLFGPEYVIKSMIPNMFFFSCLMPLRLDARPCGINMIAVGRFLLWGSVYRKRFLYAITWVMCVCNTMQWIAKVSLSLLWAQRVLFLYCMRTNSIHL